MKYYIAVYNNKEYNEDIIKDMISVNHVEHIYSPQTYWEPGEDYVDFNTEFDKDFYNTVKIMEVYFTDENSEYPYAVIVNGLTYWLGEDENWEKLLNDLGWSLFKILPFSEDFKNKEEDVIYNIQDWANEYCEKLAWEIIDNEKYGDY